MNRRDFLQYTAGTMVTVVLPGCNSVQQINQVDAPPNLIILLADGGIPNVFWREYILWNNFPDYFSSFHFTGGLWLSTAGCVQFGSYIQKSRCSWETIPKYDNGIWMQRCGRDLYKNH